MKIRFGKLLWKIALVLVVVGIVAVLAGAIYALRLSRPDYAAQKAVADTRLTLRQQGFKTDLADFDFSTPPELRAREAVLEATTPNRSTGQFLGHPNLMETVGNDSAIVVWKQDSFKNENPSWPDNRSELTWDDFREAINTDRVQIDAACDAILAGPIRFNLNASAGNTMRLPHLALLKNLTQTLGSRMVLALYDGRPDAAWTNLMAETRLVTAWNVEPAEISQLVRFADMDLVFNATWQALQTNGWPDDRLLQLQSEWESVDFFTNLPETMAFKRASDVVICQQERQRPIGPGFSLGGLPSEVFHSPSAALSEIEYFCNQIAYRKHGAYEDEKALLLFYRDREVELCLAIRAPTWAQMRQLPGVTNRIFFQSKYRSRLQSMLNFHEISTAFLKQGSSFIGRAAESEAQRRIIITAIALERYHGKHGSYPATLTELTPGFLKAPLPDVMDGQPLCYRPTVDGHFVLYSVGPDGVDDGGKLPLHDWETRLSGGATLFAAPPQADLVWPLPASDAAVQAVRQREARAEEIQNLARLEQESEEDWKQSPLRQARVAKTLATDWSTEETNMTYEGRSVHDDIRNGNVSNTNRFSLTELLTPRQIITGNEPEDLTFEVPVNYDVATNRGGLALLVDAGLDDQEEPDSGGRIQACTRATNGDCLLVWHAIYDPPGQHAVQVQLFWNSDKGGFFSSRGPAIPVTTSNLCQFSLASSTYDVGRGATFHARLPERNGLYSIECVTTSGQHLKTLSGSTSNGEFNVVWDLVDDHGHRLTGETFDSIVQITLPDSGHTQTLRGP